MPFSDEKKTLTKFLEGGYKPPSHKHPSHTTPPLMPNLYLDVWRIKGHA